MMVAHNSMNIKDGKLSNHWLLLDTCSTCSTVRDESLLDGVRDCTTEETLTVLTNGGNKVFNAEDLSHSGAFTRINGQYFVFKRFGVGRRCTYHNGYEERARHFG